MPKQSYGPVSRQRSLDLLLALLDFANDALEGSDRELTMMRSHLQVHWSAASCLIVRTKLRYLQALTELAGTPLTLAQLKTALKQLESYVGVLTDCRTITRGSDAWHFSLDVGGDRWERDAIVQAFTRRWASKREGDTSQESQGSDRTEILWKDACQRALDTQLTTNPLTACDGMTFELQDLYVPLEMVRRDRRPTLGDDEEDDNRRTYDPARLFHAWILADTVQRLAIVGDPGAGKTTLLQRFAIAVLESDRALPVWISLADLNGRSLEDYLLQTWLKQALRQVTVSDKALTAFAAECQQGRVWLLLDAADEMGGESTALAHLARDLKGWLADAHVLVTCRANVWESGKNSLASFTTYQPLGFDARQGGDRAFITSWFRRDPALGTSLIRALRQRDRTRVRTLAQKPLYLALTCRVWALTKGKLPAMKA
ncbi:MAG: NACHT domain-containing protein, partial [Cyanobacteria bacterium J06648_11]